MLLIKLLNKALLVWFRLHTYLKEIMMTIDLKEVGSGFKRTSLNENFIDIEDAINNDLLWRDGSQPMAGSLDMNSERIINLPDADTEQEPVTLGQLRSAVLDFDKAKRYEVKLGSQAVGGVFTLNEMSYTPNTNNLEVIRNGQTLIRGVHYTEVDSNTVNVFTTVLATDHFVFKSDEDIALNTTTTASVSHVDNGVEVNLNDFLQDVSSGAGVVDSFALAVASTSGGEVTTTKGYYASTPGVGSATYIKTTETGTIGETDGGSYYYGPDGFKWILLHNGSVGYTQFGADATGVSDSWEVMYACHTFANTEKIPVVQNSGAFYIEARATAPFSIPVKTNWDMSGAKVVLRQASTYPASEFKYLFEIESYTTPVALTAQELTDLNTTYSYLLEKESTKLLTTIFQDYKNAGVTLYGQTDMTRSTGQALQKIELAVIADNGGLQTPLAKDFSDGLVSATIYPADENRLIVNSPCWELAGVEDVRGIMIRNRHNVSIRDGVVVETVTQPTATVRRTFFAATGSYDIEWSNIRGEAWTQTTPPEGLYLFGGNIGANWRWTNCIGTHGWGASGLNYIKGGTFRDCALNRYDIHWAGYDLLFDNCDMHNWGVLASGGNQLTVRNCRYYLANSSSVAGDSPQYAVVQTRIDYGAEWDGDITVDGVEVIIGADFTDSWSRDLSVVKFPMTSGSYDYGREMILGRTVNVRNVQIRLEDPTRFATINKLWIMVDYGFGVNILSDYLVAHTINVENCGAAKQAEGIAILAYRPPKHYADQIRAQSDAPDIADGDYNQVVNIRNINNNVGLRTQLTNTKGELVKFGGNLSDADVGWASRVDALRPLINIDNCRGVSAGIAVNGNVNITNSEVFVLDDVANTRPNELYVRLDNCEIRMLANTATGDYLIPMNTNFDNCLFYKARTSAGAVHTLDFTKWSGATGYSPVTGSGNRTAVGFLSTNVPSGFFSQGSPIVQSGGGTLLANSINEVRDSSTYTIPLANSVTANTTLTISILDLYKSFTPTAAVSGSDTISYSGGTDTSIVFDSTTSLNLLLISDGVSDWRF